MTAVTAYSAVNEMAKLFTDYFGVANVDFPNKAFVEPSDDTTEWARIRFQHTDGGQASLANVSGQKKWSRSGIATINLYVPTGAGSARALELAEAVVGLYQGKRTASDVWFRDVHFEEVGETGAGQQPSTRYRIDVLFSFTYDQIN